MKKRPASDKGETMSLGKCSECGEGLIVGKNAKGKCLKCYHRLDKKKRYNKTNTRWRRNKSWSKGNDGFIEIRNNKNEITAIAVVDKEDLLQCVMERKWRLCKTSNNVVSGWKDKKVTTLQRFILSITYEIDKDLQVFHEDADTLNNRKCNLFCAPHMNQYDIG